MTEAGPTSHASTHGSACQRDSDREISPAFDCNICLSQAQDPVVTVCGHLYCWPCLYRWLETPSSSQNCPVCSAGVKSDKVIPLYGRGCEQIDPRKKEVMLNQETQDLIVPRRPTGQRPPSMQRARRGLYGLNNMNPLNFLSGNHTPGIGGLHTVPLSYPLTPDEQKKAFLQRFMILVGSLIVLYLIL